MSKIAIKAARAAYLAKIKEPISTKFVMGRCIPCTKQNAALIQIKQLQMDPRLKMVCGCLSFRISSIICRFYSWKLVWFFACLFIQNQFFEEKTTVYAYDPEKKVKSGDIVLVRELDEKKTTLITHAVEKIVYKLGDIVDPVTNKPVVGDEYRDIINERNELYGKVENAFDYEKAPARGRLEGTRDFTDKPTYTKYYADCDDPYAW